MTDVVRIELSRASRVALERLRVRVGPAALRGDLLRFFERQSSIVAGSISSTMLSGQRLKRRTGALARSIVGRSTLVGGSPAFQVGILGGPSLAYARVQELGTRGKNPDSPIPTIVPKRAKALAIPTGPALTAAGVHRFNSPRDYPGGLFFVPSFRGNLVGLLFPKKGRGRGKIPGLGGPPAYLLVRKVDVAPKFFLRDGFAAALPRVSEDLAKFLKGRVVGAHA